MPLNYTNQATYSVTLLNNSGLRLTGYTGLWNNLVGLETGTAITAQPTVTERFNGLYTYAVDWADASSDTYSGFNSGHTLAIGEDLAGTLDFGKRATCKVEIKTDNVNDLDDDVVVLKANKDTDGTGTRDREFKFIKHADNPYTSGDWWGAKLIILTDSASALTGKTLVLTNTDGSTHTITVAALGGGNPSTATQVNVDIVGNANDFATQLHASLSAAEAAGSLKMGTMPISNSTAGDPRVITLFQNVGGTESETAVSGTLIDTSKIKINTDNPGNANGDLKFLDGTKYIAVNIAGLSAKAAIATELYKAIVHANALGGYVIAEVGAEDGGSVPIAIKQYYHGSGGNQNNSTTDAGNVAVSNFANGITLADALRYVIVHMPRSDIGFADVLEDTSKLVDVEFGKWEIVSNQLVLYKQDGVTVLKTFNLQDKNGQATSVSPYKRIPV